MLRKILLPLLALLSIGACAQENLLEIQGKIFVKGSAPHTYLVIEESNTHKAYKITNGKDFNLMQKQKQTIRIKAKPIKDAIGPGFPAEIEIISVNP